MKSLLQTLASFVGALALVACGGGSGGGSTPAFDAPALSKTELAVGTGAALADGKYVTMNYTSWLYNPNASGSKGTQIGSSVGSTTTPPLTFTVGVKSLVPGLEQGVAGMLVGGKRSIVIPSSLAYGAAGSPPSIPGNSGLVFEVEILSAVTIYDVPDLIKTDVVVGTGATVVNGKTVTVNYTGWLYDAAAGDFKGTQFDTSVGKAAFSFKAGLNNVIMGWENGVNGMKAGGKRTLIIPSRLAYGTKGSASIPPNAALIFDIEVVKVE